MAQPHLDPVVINWNVGAVQLGKRFRCLWSSPPALGGRTQTHSTHRYKHRGGFCGSFLQTRLFGQENKWPALRGKVSHETYFPVSLTESEGGTFWKRVHRFKQRGLG